MFALVDCNNFYVSCERLFEPRLEKRAVVVLSNNDGCIIARSEEVKRLGIPMGAPIFEWKQLLHKRGAVIRSANFSLYGDMARRVIETLKTFALPIEVYSIDESFLEIPALFDEESIRKKVLQWTGIPVSVGIAPTKTLAKAANRLAKKAQHTVALYNEKEADPFLKRLPIEAVWGVGKKKAQHMRSFGIQTAFDLKYCDPHFLKKHYSILAERVALELQGISCIPLEDTPQPKQSITCSRSFGTPIYQLEQLREAIATFTAKAAEKLRQERSVASLLIVHTNLHSAQMPLSPPTSDPRVLLARAEQLLTTHFEPKAAYKKGGVVLSGICSAHSAQQDLFQNARSSQAIEALDSINRRFGKSAVRFVAEGTTHEWKSRREFLSPNYTTAWCDIPKVKAD